MHVLLVFLLIVLAGLAIPLLVLLLQVGLSLTYSSTKKQQPCSILPCAAVLIPAHNESVNLIPTINSIKAQAVPNLKIVVIADNCEDDTAQIALEMDVTVIERKDPTRRGKGYALDFGVQYLASTEPPEVVVIIDADCLLSPGSLGLLVSECSKHHTPVQALYLMKTKADAALKTKIAELAWLVKNWVRPLGFHMIGLPCHLMGSGMAFPWAVLNQASLASGHIVEDVKLGIDLVKKGFPPRFLPESQVISYFPTNETGLRSQRSRWEHGHIGMILKEGPSLIVDSIFKRDIAELFIALDLIVPPLALLAMMLLTGFFLSTLLFLITSIAIPFVISLSMLVVFLFTILMAWYCFGRQVISFLELAKIPGYVVSKVPVYFAYFYNRQTDWIRSKRDQ